MNLEKNYNNHENIQTTSVEPPSVESFHDHIRAAEVWPEKIAADRNFLEQVKEHKELNDNLDAIIKNLHRPDMNIETAISQKHLTEDQVAALYVSLGNTLGSGQNYERLALYLPFEFLPDKNWQPSGEKLQQASTSFKKNYMQAWRSLLSIYDVRANFVDGDVMEKDHRTGDHPRVVKAAHLVPKLIEKGMLEFEEVITIMEKSDDQILKDSLADALPVLADMGLLGEREIALMEKSEDRLINNMARIITANRQTAEQSPRITSSVINFLSVKEKLSAEFYNIDSTDYGDITRKRKEWLQQKKKQEAVKASGLNISQSINKNNFTPEIAKDFISEAADHSSQQALIEGVRQSVESTSSIDPVKAQKLYAEYKNTLLELWEDSYYGTRETLEKTFLRLRQLEIIDNRQLQELGIALPKLAGPFSKNLKLIEKETNDIKNIITVIEKDPALSKLIYPVVILYGSRLKGYGTQKSDTDPAIFVKPEVSLDNRQALRVALEKYFTPEKFQGEITEFWLEERDDQLKIKDFSEPDDLQGESHWTHILFGGAWEGNKKTIEELREKLLTPYLYKTEKTIQGRPARERYLEELERDTLQYRLMHKGYEKFFPPCGGIHTAHSDEIDGESMFWDSGYRQLATKLFASRVFLPEIPKKTE